MCVYSRHLAVDIAERCLQVEIDVIDIAEAEGELPDSVFATPTWLWDGKLFSLGNPDPAQIWRRLAEIGSHIPTTLPKEKSHGREDAASIDNGNISGFIGEGTGGT